MPTSAPPRTSRSSRSSRRSHRSTNSGLTKTSVIINVYDLLPPGRLSSVFWTLGVALLHSGVVINDKEYAFGGHDKPGVTGVYWTKPRTEPPGGTWRCEILHGFTYASPEEIEEIIREASQEFSGTSYNLLERNCNKFTSHLCEALTGQPAPAYLNRAAAIGLALPCIVPQGWVEPPECELEEHSEEAPLTGRRHSMDEDSRWDSSDDDYLEERERQQKEARRAGQGRKGREPGDVRDTGGRELPGAERAIMDHTMR